MHVCEGKQRVQTWKESWSDGLGWWMKMKDYYKTVLTLLNCRSFNSASLLTAAFSERLSLEPRVFVMGIGNLAVRQKIVILFIGFMSVEIDDECFCHFVWAALSRVCVDIQVCSFINFYFMSHISIACFTQSLNIIIFMFSKRRIRRFIAITT